MSTREQFEAQFNQAVAADAAARAQSAAQFNRTAAVAGGTALVLNLVVLGALGYVIWRVVKKK